MLFRWSCILTRNNCHGRIIIPFHTSVLFFVLIPAFAHLRRALNTSISTSFQMQRRVARHYCFSSVSSRLDQLFNTDMDSRSLEGWALRAKEGGFACLPADKRVVWWLVQPFTAVHPYSYAAVVLLWLKITTWRESVGLQWYLTIQRRLQCYGHIQTFTSSESSLCRSVVSQACIIQQGAFTFLFAMCTCVVLLVLGLASVLPPQKLGVEVGMCRVWHEFSWCRCIWANVMAKKPKKVHRGQIK